MMIVGVYATLGVFLLNASRNTSVVWALIRRNIRLRGSPRLLQAFGRCCPVVMRSASVG
jgi:hypothetical protein